MFKLITPGKFYSSTTREEVPPTETPDVWICRRVVDYKPGQIPKDAAVAPCTKCKADIVYNPARKLTCPKVCMQCEDIEPLEIT